MGDKDNHDVETRKFDMDELMRDFEKVNEVKKEKSEPTAQDKAGSSQHDDGGQQSPK